MRSLPSWIRAVLIVTVVTTLGIRPVSAWEVIETRAGIDGAFRRGCWIPVELTAVNGTEPFRGTLAVEVDGAQRFGREVTASPAGRVSLVFWVAAHTPSPRLVLVCTSDGISTSRPLKVDLKEPDGPMVAILPGVEVSPKARAAVAAPAGMPIRWVTFRPEGAASDPLIFESVDAIVSGPMSEWRSARSDFASAIEAWKGMGGWLVERTEQLDLSEWKPRTRDPRVGSAAMDVVTSRDWPIGRRNHALRGLGWLAGGTVIGLLLARALRERPVQAWLPLIGGIAGGAGAAWGMMPPDRAQVDSALFCEVGEGARLKGTTLVAPVRVREWRWVRGIPAEERSPLLGVRGPLRRRWREASDAEGMPAGELLRLDSGAWVWSAPRSAREPEVLLEGVRTEWSPLAVAVSLEEATGTAPARWRCGVWEERLESAARYLSDGERIWTNAVSPGGDTLFAWPAEEAGVPMAKFAERAGRAGDTPEGIRDRLALAAADLSSHGRQVLILVSDRGAAPDSNGSSPLDAEVWILRLP